MEDQLESKTAQVEHRSCKCDDAQLVHESALLCIPVAPDLHPLLFHNMWTSPGASDILMTGAVHGGAVERRTWVPHPLPQCHLPAPGCDISQIPHVKSLRL